MQEFAPLYQIEMVVADRIPDFEDLPLENFEIANNNVKIVYDKQKIDTAQILEHIIAQTKVVDMRIFEPNLEETIKRFKTLQT